MKLHVYLNGLLTYHSLSTIYSKDVILLYRDITLGWIQDSRKECSDTNRRRQSPFEQVQGHHLAENFYN